MYLSWRLWIELNLLSLAHKKWDRYFNKEGKTSVLYFFDETPEKYYYSLQ